MERKQNPIAVKALILALLVGATPLLHAADATAIEPLTATQPTVDKTPNSDDRPFECASLAVIRATLREHGMWLPRPAQGEGYVQAPLREIRRLLITLGLWLPKPAR